MRTLPPEIMKRIVAMQRGEAAERIIYERLARATADPHNRKVLSHIAADEGRHYEFWKAVTGHDVRPSRLKIALYYVMARALGITFTIKLMERGEAGAQVVYETLADEIPGVDRIIADEDKHEHELIDLIDEQRLRYVGSIVLGLSDALVELTGALAGFTLALKDTRIIAATGLITGIAAALSMAASEYQSTRSEGDAKNPLRAAFYTGMIYIVTVILLIVPYLVLGGPGAALATTMAVALGIILFFTFYVSVASGVPFLRRFAEMAAIIFGVATISFFIGWAVKSLFGVAV